MKKAIFEGETCKLIDDPLLLGLMRKTVIPDGLSKDFLFYLRHLLEQYINLTGAMSEPKLSLCLRFGSLLLYD